MAVIGFKLVYWPRKAYRYCISFLENYIHRSFDLSISYWTAKYVIFDLHLLYPSRASLSRIRGEIVHKYDSSTQRLIRHFTPAKESARILRKRIVRPLKT